MSIDYDYMRADYRQSINESLFDCKNFGEHMRLLIKEKGWDTVEFSEWTGLNNTMFSRIKRDDYMPDKRIFATLCVAFELGMFEVMRIIQFTKITVLQKDDLLQKYFYVIDCHRGKAIEECNDILRALGVEEKDLLGSRKNKKSDK